VAELPSKPGIPHLDEEFALGIGPRFLRICDADRERHRFPHGTAQTHAHIFRPFFTPKNRLPRTASGWRTGLTILFRETIGGYVLGPELTWGQGSTISQFIYHGRRALPTPFVHQMHGAAALARGAETIRVITVRSRTVISSRKTGKPRHTLSLAPSHVTNSRYGYTV